MELNWTHPSHYINLFLNLFSVIILSFIPVYLSRRNDFQTRPIQSSLRQVTYSLPLNNIYAALIIDRSTISIFILIGNQNKESTTFLCILFQYQTIINSNSQTVDSVINSPDATIVCPTMTKQMNNFMCFNIEMKSISLKTPTVNQS